MPEMPFRLSNLLARQQVNAEQRAQKNQAKEYKQEQKRRQQIEKKYQQIELRPSSRGLERKALIQEFFTLRADYQKIVSPLRNKIVSGDSKRDAKFQLFRDFDQQEWRTLMQKLDEKFGSQVNSRNFDTTTETPWRKAFPHKVFSLDARSQIDIDYLETRLYGSIFPEVDHPIADMVNKRTYGRGDAETAIVVSYDKTDREGVPVESTYADDLFEPIFKDLDIEKFISEFKGYVAELMAELERKAIALATQMDELDT